MALLAGGYFLFEYIVSVFAALESQARSLAAIGSVVILLSAVIIAEGLKARVPKDAVSAAERAATYRRLLSFCCERLKEAQSPSASAAGADLVNIERSLVLQGSTKVMCAYIELRRLTMQGGAASETGLALLNTLVAEMRSDLGKTGLMRKQSEVLELLTDQIPTVS